MRGGADSNRQSWKSDFPYINWSKETRHLLFADSNFEEDVTYLILTENNTDSKSKVENLEPNSFNRENYETIDGPMKWESQVDIGPLMIEVLLTIDIISGIFNFVIF